MKALPHLCVFVIILTSCDEQTPPGPEVPQLPWVEVSPDLCVARGLSTSSWNLQESLAVLDQLGVSSLRGDYYWHRIEPTQGEFDFSSYDPVVDELLGLGIEPLALLGYGNPWASDNPNADHFYPPEDPADFAAYAATTAEHFAGRIHRYEIWNEQNAGYRFWKPELSGDPVAYGALFAEAADAIHAVDPAAQVAIGGTFFHDQFIMGGLEFLSLMGTDAWESADALAFHPYTFYPPSVPPEYDGDSDVSQGKGEVPLVEMISNLRSVATDAGRADIPILVTEFGWPSWGEVDMTEQADWAERAVLLGLSQGVSTWCGYTIFNREPGGAEDRFGMADPNGVLTPYGERMRDLAERLDGVEAAAMLELPDSQYGVALRGPGTQERRIVWGSGSLSLDDGTTVSLGSTPSGW